MNDILDKIQQICRVCLLEQSLMFSMLHRSCLNQNILTMIMSCTSIKIELDDNLPQLICSNCLGRLETAYLFRQECERSDFTLRRLLAENEEKIDNKYKQYDFNEQQNDTNGKQNISDNDCDTINASSVVKVEINVDENEILDIKNEQSDKDDDSSDDYIERKLRKRVLRNITKIKVKKIKKPEINKRYKCSICDKTFRHHKRYWLHKNEHPTFSCYVCWKQFPNIELLEKHNEEHPNQLYVCNHEECEQQFSNCRSFVLHKKNDHEIINYLHCSECDKTFHCHEKWDIHIQKHLRSPFVCEVCPEIFNQKVMLEKHMKLHDEFFKCEQCDKTFSTRKNLERHKKTHDNTFICEECGRKYCQRYNLKKHIDVAHKGKKNPRRLKTHLCPHCGQFFARPVDLTTHIRIHTGSKPFGCDKCEYRCHDKNLLRSHVRVHSGERPYRCDFCGKCFATRSYLTVHIRFHTGYRPYICSYTPCKKGFTNSKDLKVHERTHTGIKLYHCNICNNSFTTLHYLKVHTKKHETQ